MAWSTYHRLIRFTANSNTYSVKIDNLEVRAIPISLSGSTDVELFDGRKTQRIDGWRYTVEISIGEVRKDTQADEHTIWRNIIHDIDEGGGVEQIDFDPANLGTKTLENLVLVSGEGTIKAEFRSGVRARPVSIELDTKEIYENVQGVSSPHPYTWIVQ